MNYIKHLTGFFEKVAIDQSLNPTHVSLYIALFQFWNFNRFRNPISINRDEVMRISKISSKATYHKCLKNLHNQGHIHYEPSYNPFKGSHVVMYNFSEDLKPNFKAGKKDVSIPSIEQVIKLASEQVPDKLYSCSETSDEQALVPLKNNINKTNSQNFENERTFEKKRSTEFHETHFLDANLEKKKMLLEKKPADHTNESQTKNYKSLQIFEIIPPRLDDVKAFFEEMEIDAVESERFFNHFQSNGWLVGGKSKMKNWQASAKNWILNRSSFVPSPVLSNPPHPGNLKTSNQKKYDEPL